MLKTVINCHVRNRRLQNQTEKVPCTVLLNYLHTFVFYIFSVFHTLYLHIINIRYLQVLFITQERLGKSQSATSCRGSIAAVLVNNLNAHNILNQWFNPLSANFTKWSNTLIQFVGILLYYVIQITSDIITSFSAQLTISALKNSFLEVNSVIFKKYG